jgi:hypothetical protein
VAESAEFLKVEVEYYRTPLVVDSFALFPENLQHDVLRSQFYDAMYECAKGDESARKALRSLGTIANRIDAGAYRQRGTDQYGLRERPGTVQIANWLEKNRLQTIENIGKDILYSIDVVRKHQPLRRSDPFRLRAYAHDVPAPYLPGREPEPHTPGKPAWIMAPDQDSIDIRITGSWRKNARTGSFTKWRDEILDDLKLLLNEELKSVEIVADSLGVRRSKARETALHMRWLVLAHFPDSTGIRRTPREYVLRECELRNDHDDCRCEHANLDTADREVRNLAGKLGLKLNRKRGAPAREAMY